LGVADGETLCILGPSGCGKTTLLRSMHGLLPLDAGRVLIGGAAVERPRRDVAMVFQHFGLFPWKTVAANVSYGIELAGVRDPERRERTARYIDLVRLPAFEHPYPSHLSTVTHTHLALA